MGNIMESGPVSLIRHDWHYDEIKSLFDLPFMDLLFKAQQIHRQFFDPNSVQVSTLLSIKTGACPEDCKYCSQSTRYDTGLDKEQLMEINQVVQEALEAKKNGSTRFCMGAAWRSPKPKQMPMLTEMVKQVKALGLETCMTLGMLDEDKAQQLGDAGLDYYNHNIDTSPEYYSQVITTRSFQQRLDTLTHVRKSGMKVCSGGIMGMGESKDDRIGFLQQLSNMPAHPESVPINMLVKIKGTPLDDALSEQEIDNFDFIRCIAVARVLMPMSFVRLSAGRENMSDEMQAFAFMAGANSIFYGDKLLTTPNADMSDDMLLLKRLGLKSMSLEQGENKLPDFNHGMKKNDPVLFYNAISN
jgi:biotin synthase